MVGHDHGPSGHVETETEEMAARNARVGRVLFVIYLVAYVGYMVLVAFVPAALRKVTPPGVNVAISYGFSLIVGALVLALIYAWMCRAGKSDG
jgi:uncharacterized membrane protein (DUF485 family)